MVSASPTFHSRITFQMSGISWESKASLATCRYIIKLLSVVAVDWMMIDKIYEQSVRAWSGAFFPRIEGRSCRSRRASSIASAKANIPAPSNELTSLLLFLDANERMQTNPVPSKSNTMNPSCEKPSWYE